MRAPLLARALTIVTLSAIGVVLWWVGWPLFRRYAPGAVRHNGGPCDWGSREDTSASSLATASDEWTALGSSILTQLAHVHPRYALGMYRGRTKPTTRCSLMLYLPS